VNNGFWDTYRTIWSAYSLLYPTDAGELVNGFVQQYRDGGWVARWSSPGYANLMTGTSSDVAFTYSYVKGVRNYNVKDVYDAALKDATVAPPGPDPNDTNVGRKGLQTALFLGYANMPDGIGWVLGSLVAGNMYEQRGDKVNLARRFLDEHASTDSAREWIDGFAQAAAGATSETWTDKAVEEATTRAHDMLGLAGDAPQVAQALRALPDDDIAGAVAEVIPRGHVIDFAVAHVPTLPDGTATTAATLRDWMFHAYDPGQVWIPFFVSGAVSVVLMLLYDRWVRSRNRTQTRSTAAA